MILGPVLLFGSGETSPAGQRLFDLLLRRLPPSPRIALLETPAGFEPNSAQVIGRVADFLHRRLQNYHPQVTPIPARKRGTPNSPDEPGVIAPLFRSDLIFMGPGSPSYTVRQLRNSLAWHALVTRHRLGAALALSSAAVVAVSAHSLPVYEIYKVGEELHWIEGLDLFGSYGLRLVFIPHWNNTDGGQELDTSRCWMGQARFEGLLDLLPEGLSVVGIDEKTGLLLDFAACTCQVAGSGGVTLLTAADRSGRRNAVPHIYRSGECFPVHELGEVHLPEPGSGLPEAVWRQACETAGENGPAGASGQEAEAQAEPAPPSEVLALVKRREAARQDKDWWAADALRDQIASLGWQVIDTPEGPVVKTLAN